MNEPFFHQGLGKTIQSISFLAQLTQEEEEGPHIVICPSSTLGMNIHESVSHTLCLNIHIFDHKYGDCHACNKYLSKEAFTNCLRGP